MIAGLRAGTATERGVAAAVFAAEAACVAAIAVLVGLLVWTLAAPGSAVPPAPALSSNAATGQAAPRAARDWSVLWTADPFRPSGAAPAEAAQDAPETTLNLVLLGVRTPAGDAPGAAYIKTPDNQQGAYRPGQEIISGVTLEAIEADRVAISRSGARETLYLDGPRRGDGVAASGAANAVASAGPAPVLSPEDFMDAAEFRAVSRDGRILGLRVVDVRNPGLMQRIGLRQEDIVLAVGGQSLASAGDPSAALQRAQRAGRVELTIERDGARMPLTLEFESLQ